MKHKLILSVALPFMATSCGGSDVPVSRIEFPDEIVVEGITQNPEGIEYHADEHVFFLGSLNAAPIIKVHLDGSFKPFTSGETFSLSSAGIQVDSQRSRLLATGFNGMELLDNDPATKGLSQLRIYDLETGILQQDINLSSLMPEADQYFANDVTVDSNGNAYVSDWYANVVYKVDVNGNPTVFWRNNSGVSAGPNGLDFHPDGFLLVSLINDGTYSVHGLVKIPVDDASLASLVSVSDSAFSGFDGMVVNSAGNVVGVSNNGESPGGNVLIELSGTKDWESAEVIRQTEITTSTTVAITPDNRAYVINQDFSNNFASNWRIEQVSF